VDSPTQFTLTLTCDCAGRYYPLLGDAETAPVAPESMASNTKTSTTVIGAGPMKIDSFTPNVNVEMSKNANFYDAKSEKLGGMEIVHVATGPGSMPNALRSGAIDWAGPALGSDADTFSAPYEVVQQQLDAPYYAVWCIEQASPLADLKVRQALNYATDRNEINERLYDGRSKVAWSLYPSSEPQGNKSLDNLYKYNPKKAKKLLAEAGHPDGFTVRALDLGDATSEYGRISQILKAQWAKVGVTLDAKQSTNFAADWFANKAGDQFTSPLTREGISRVTRWFTSDALVNACKYPAPKIDALATQLSALPVDDPKAHELWQEIEEELNKSMALGVPLVFMKNTYVVNTDRIGNLEWLTTPVLSWQPDPTKVFIKK
jgi:peptide/nickel transport system substrate-binding protein